MDFRDRLFDLRRQAGLSQEELANLLGLTRQAVQKWEAGTSRPDMDNLVALANYFHVSLDYLVTGRKSKAISGFLGEFRLRNLWLSNYIQLLVAMSAEFC